MARGLWILVFVCVWGGSWLAPAGSRAFGEGIPQVSGTLHTYGARSALLAWGWAGDRLWLTADGGVSWQDRTPAGQPAAAAVDWLDGVQGWAVSLDSGDPGRFRLSATADGGVTWQVSHHLLPAHAASLAGDLALFWLDRQHGWLTLRLLTSSNFDRGLLLRTQDGGRSWQQVTAPAGSPVVFVSAHTGWMVGGAGQEIFWRSDDGGASWQEVAGPLSEAGRDWWRLDLATNTLQRRQEDGGWSAVLRGEVPLLAGGRGAGEVSALGARTSRLTGPGFDMCELTGEENLRRWVVDSPYRAVNLYIGGVLRACANRRLDAVLLASLTVQGWRFIPTWVGPQAPCTEYRQRFASDPAAAYAQGRAEAEQALRVASELGLAAADGSGTVLYYNLEAYDGQNAACVAAAQAFVAGWTERVQASASAAGLYALACTPPIARYADRSPILDAVWFAAWNRSTFDPEMTVWQISSSCLPPTLWAERQRIRQYAGDHTETWGEVTLPIDSNAVEGIVADLSGVVVAPLTVVVETPSIEPKFDPASSCEDGWHRFTTVRGQPAYLAFSQRVGETIPPLNHAVWRPQLPVEGLYRVEALIPSHGAIEWPCRGLTLSPDTAFARYTVYHAEGVTTTVQNQMPVDNSWLRLGSYRFAAGEQGAVVLDAAAQDHPRLVSFSALRFVLEEVQGEERKLYLPLLHRRGAVVR